MDYLRVDVVKTIDASFKSCNLPVMPVDELLEKVKDDPKIWKLYADGFTMGLNQVERDKTTERVKRFKPTNVVELAAFVAAVRPGFKSMLETFINREHFEYGIPSLDKLLMTKEIPSSFLMYDEQILKVLQAAGIPPADAYQCVKAIKKKKTEKVKSYKERFTQGFTKVLRESEGASEEEAELTVDRVWTIINDAASYMFCCAHAFSMACDCLYAAYLKVYHPYEFYASMLKIYTNKGNMEKIAAISSEMKRYMGITVTLGRFGEDNRSWYINKENKTIAQDLNSIKFISPNVSTQMLRLSHNDYDHFTDLLYDIQMTTPINARQIKVLISLNYFEPFGKIGKLQKLYEYYTTGPNKIQKHLIESSQYKRLDAIRKYEDTMENDDVPIEKKLTAEMEYIGRCVSVDKNENEKVCYVENVDTTYGVKVLLYNVNKGTVATLKVQKMKFESSELHPGELIDLKKCEQRQRYSYQLDGTRRAIPDVFDWWMQDYKVISAA